MIRKIYFRADGDSRMGLGHLFRSSALAEMLTSDYECILVTKCRIEEVINELKKSFDDLILLEGMQVEKEVSFLQKLNVDQSLIVLDGYHFDSKYQELLVEKSFDIFCIDDIHAYQFYSKVIINHAGGLSFKDYKATPSTQFYLGPQYALLKKPFLEAARKRRVYVTDNNCMICFGGSDPGNKTLEVVEKIKLTHGSFDHLHIITGSGYLHKEALEKIIRNDQKMTWHQSLSATEMIQVMQQCSYAICSPSTIVYEYLSVGGIVFLEQIADNQKDVIQYLTEERIAFRLEDIEKLSEIEIKYAFEKSAQYFDGCSGERLKKVFRQHFDAKDLKVRRVESGDEQVIFEWANDLEVRRQSYNQQVIQWSSHQDWFQKKLIDKKSYYYIFEMNSKPVAQIRFQVSGDEAILGYLAGNSIRSKGLGTSILAKGIEALIKESPKPLKIVGYVKKSNIASQRSFEKLSFLKEDANDYLDSYKYTIIYGN
jgi:UDP-2,4-diacetamido-2,4,6-trideoxy-beta-L-altropyranose hydrolase